MKTNPYVEYIVRKLSLQGLDGNKNIFKIIKGLLYKICLKFTAFTRYFTFNGPAYAQVFGIIMQNTLKPICMCEIKCAAYQNQHFES